MGRFYRTASPTFIPDNIYMPPVDLMIESIVNADAKTDDLVAKTALLEGIVDEIQHLNFQSENDRVKSIQEKYQKEIDTLSSQIAKNPLAYQDYNNRIQKLKKDLIQDRTSGDLFHIEQRFKDYQTWLENNKDASPHLLNTFNSHWFNDVAGRATSDPSAKFQGQAITNRPEIIKTYQKNFEDIKANSTIASDGKYIYKGQELSEDEVARIAWDTLVSHPDYAGFVNQMGNTLGQKEYFENPFMYIDEQGNPISLEDYQNMSAEEKDKVDRGLNPSNPFYSDLAAVAGTYGFKQMDTEIDPYGKMQAQQIGKERLAKIRGQQSMNLAKVKGGQARELAKLKHEYKMAEKAADFAENYKKAVENGDVQKQEESLIFGIPEAIVTPERQQEVFDSWHTMYNAKIEGRNYDELELQKLNLILEPVIESNADLILRSYGDNPKDYATSEARISRVSKILSEINKLDDPQHKYYREEAGGMQLTATDSESPTYAREQAIRDKVKATKGALEDVWGDYNKYMSENLNSVTKYKSVANNEDSSRVLKIVSDHIRFINPISQKGGLTNTDIDGKQRKADRIDVDKGFWHAGRTPNPLAKMIDVAGVGTLEELVAQGYVKAAHTPTDENEVTFLWTPTPEFTKKATLQLADDAKIGSFKTVHSDIAEDIYPKTDNPEDNALHYKAKYGKDFDAIKTKIDYAEALQKKDYEKYKALYPNGYPMRIPGFQNTVFSVDQKLNGDFTIIASSEDRSKKHEIGLTKKEAEDLKLSSKTALQLMLLKGVQNVPEILEIENQTDE